MKQRRLIEYGFMAFNGVRWNDYAVDAYNRVQEDINRSIRSGYRPSEQLLNASHRQFCIFSRTGE